MKFLKPSWLITTTLGALLLSACNLGATPAPTVDAGAVQTQAFNVVLTEAAMQQTQTALAIPPTALPTDTPVPTAVLPPTFAPIGESANTPFAITPVDTPITVFTPFALPTATSMGIATVTTKNGCNDGAYVGETGPAQQDWDVLEGGKIYTKAWTIVNTGTCKWDEGYAFVLLEERSSAGIKWDTKSIIIKGTDTATESQHSQSFVVKFTAPRQAGKYEAYWKMHDDANNYFGPMVWIRFTIQ